MHRILTASLLLGCLAAPAWAQTRVSAFGIADNSFLVEEAFNQERGIFQNIFLVSRPRPGEWNMLLTQEWPLGSQRHQFSFTLPFVRSTDPLGVSDLVLNYRFQFGRSGPGNVAFSPRISAIFATSEERRAIEDPGVGWQVNLPLSYERGRWMLHANAGATWLKEPTSNGGGAWTNTPFAAASANWALRRMFHPMVEVYVEWPQDPDTKVREASVTVLAGFRAGWDFGDRQLVIGFGVPIAHASTTDLGGLVYVSYELPFRRKR